MGFGSTDFCPDLSCKWELDLNMVLARELQMLNEKCKPLAQILLHHQKKTNIKAMH